ncbi:MAG TPA: hypothetical protein DEP19_03970 [Anaerolineae bacterium]|nr:hypothetical protein [Anaerolineae bacterium]
MKASAEGAVSVVALDNEAFNSLIADSRTLREELTGIIEKRNIYNQLQAISSFNQTTLAEILKQMKPIQYESEHEIIKQGDVGKTFYLLLDGQVDILVKNEHGEEVRVNQLSKGAYFGEMAMMGDKRRQATVRVSKGKFAKVIELTAEEFEKLTESSAEFKTHVQKVAGVRKKEIEGSSKRKVRK